jgi:hypothetical protein
MAVADRVAASLDVSSQKRAVLRHSLFLGCGQPLVWLNCGSRYREFETDSAVAVVIWLSTNDSVTTPLLIFEPPVTIEECRSAGRALGSAWGSRPRVAFEQALIERLTVLVDAFAPAGLDADEALAAFDQSAWAAWEAAQSPTPGDQGSSDPRRARETAKVSC